MCVLGAQMNQLIKTVSSFEYPQHTFWLRYKEFLLLHSNLGGLTGQAKIAFITLQKYAKVSNSLDPNCLQILSTVYTKGERGNRDLNK